MALKIEMKKEEVLSSNTETVRLTQTLIECPSITPNDAGCQDLIAKRLKQIGFTVHDLPFENVSNLWATYGQQSPVFVFAGHSDVVPPGPLEDWLSPPFTPTLKEDFLYGRGTADMKGSLAAMITAMERFLSRNPNFPSSLGLLITSDEEGPAHHGTKRVIEYLKSKNIAFDYCLVGEPSSQTTLGDTIKIGRRGSLSGRLTIRGIQGHIAYPDKALNPIHLAMNSLSALTNRRWDTGNEHFPPTTFQISNIHSGTGAGNVIPGSLECLFNFRFSNEQNPEALQNAVSEILSAQGLQYDLKWELSGQPFLNSQGQLLAACQRAIQTLFKFTPTLSTSGGTSDARFIAPYCKEVLELGPSNATIHQVNERIAIKELNELSYLYEEILTDLFYSRLNAGVS